MVGEVSLVIQLQYEKDGVQSPSFKHFKGYDHFSFIQKTTIIQNSTNTKKTTEKEKLKFRIAHTVTMLIVSLLLKTYRN